MEQMEKPQFKVGQLRDLDIPAVMELKDSENWNQTEYDWSMLLQCSPELCLAATLEEKVVGTVTGTNYSNEVGWIGMMLVGQNHRGQGIGRILMKSIIDKMGNIKSIKLDATPKGRPLYSKLGFKDDIELIRMVCQKVPSAVLDKKTAGIHKVTLKEMENVIDFDRKVFGADRSDLLHTLWKNPECKMYCLKQEGVILGYASIRPGSKFWHIGPLFAKKRSVAEALLKYALYEYQGFPVVLDVLGTRYGIRTLLASYGFRPQRKFTRMYLNRNITGKVKLQFLIAGPEIG